MKLSFVKVAGMALGIVAASISIPAANAVNINSQGAICQNFNAAQALDIDYLSSGVRNINASPRQVICSAPRAPISPLAFFGSFYVDGINTTRATISCTLSSFDFTGEFLGSMSFNTPANRDFDTLVLMPASQLPSFAYTSLLCTLPGNGASVLYGVSPQ